MSAIDTDVFTDFKKCIVELGNTRIFATSASLKINTSLDQDRRLIGWNESTQGAKINNPKSVPVAGVSGEVSFDFVVSKPHFNYENNTNSIASIFDIRDMTEEFVSSGRLGNYKFYNAALKSFEFTMRPFSLIEASASYEIFGGVLEVATGSEPYTSGDINPAESLKSFGEVIARGINYRTAKEMDMNIITANYRASVNRRFNYTIRANEKPINNYVPGAIMPYRASVESVVVDCSITSNKIIERMNESGHQQQGSQHINTQEMEIKLELYEAKGASEKIAEFSTLGAITSQNLSVSEGSYLMGDLSIQQILK